MKQDEAKLSENVASYLRAKKLIFRFDITDMNLTMPQALRQKRIQMIERGFTDLMIFEPRNNFHGMFVELKNKYSDVYKKDETYKKVTKPIKHRGKVVGHYDHIQEQHKMHERLRAKGYHVVWGLGYKDTIDKIEEYLK